MPKKRSTVTCASLVGIGGNLIVIQIFVLFAESLNQMPYIKQKDRIKWDNDLKHLNKTSETDGIDSADLAYIICRTIKIYLNFYGGQKTTWAIKANVVKVIDSVLDVYKAEVLLPHEERKRNENGSIF